MRREGRYDDERRKGNMRRKGVSDGRRLSEADTGAAQRLSRRGRSHRRQDPPTWKSLISPFHSDRACRWAGRPPVEFERVRSHETDGFEVAEFRIGSHAGTHVDAPATSLQRTLDQYPIDRFVGRGGA